MRCHDTGDGFRHVWSARPILSLVDTPGESSPKPELSCVASAAFLSRGVKDMHSRAKALVIWRAPSSEASDNGSGAMRHSTSSARQPHGGEPVVVYLRAGNTPVLEIHTKMVNFSDWPNISRDLDAALDGSSASDASGWLNLLNVASDRKNGNRTMDRAEKVVRDRAFVNIRERSARQAVRRAIDRNLESIKKRLWRPGGRLVARLFEDEVGARSEIFCRP